MLLHFEENVLRRPLVVDRPIDTVGTASHPRGMKDVEPRLPDELHDTGIVVDEEGYVV